MEYFHPIPSGSLLNSISIAATACGRRSISRTTVLSDHLKDSLSHPRLDASYNTSNCEALGYVGEPMPSHTTRALAWSLSMREIIAFFGFETLLNRTITCSDS